MSAFIDRFGEMNIMKCGLKAVIIRYGGSEDIDVMFENGTVVKNKRYERFKNGSLNPNYSREGSDKKQHNFIDRIGELSISNQGYPMTIVEYTSSKDMIVEFEGGFQVKSRYDRFLNGQIAHPDLDNAIRDPLFVSKIGEESVNLYGINMRIVRMLTAKRVVIQFEDGKEVTAYYQSFRSGRVHHPMSPSKLEGKVFGTMMLGKDGYYDTQEKRFYYDCHCIQCQRHGLMPLDDIVVHIC